MVKIITCFIIILIIINSLTFLFYYQMIIWNMFILRWLLCKWYIHTLVRVSWHNYVCILNICHVLLLYNYIVFNHAKYTIFEVAIEANVLMASVEQLPPATILLWLPPHHQIVGPCWKNKES